MLINLLMQEAGAAGHLDPSCICLRCKIMTKHLSEKEKNQLLSLARETLKAAVNEQDLPEIELAACSPRLKKPGACFVTLTKNGQLRGCVGTLEAEKPLVINVQERALAAAFKDYRFPALREEELKDLRIEISYLSAPQPLAYDQPQELPAKLTPGVDGVVISDGLRKATFLPQVWEKLPDPEEFLSRLCLKMGVSGDHWRSHRLEVKTYRVEKFREKA